MNSVSGVEKAFPGSETERQPDYDMTSRAQGTFRVLLIEDEQVYVSFIHEVLANSSEFPFKLEVCMDWSSGMERMKANHFDVVVLDINLPDSGTSMTLKRLAPLVRRYPVVILTGEEDLEMALRAVREGAQDYLLKHEIAPKVFVRSLRYAVERWKWQQAQRESEAKYAAVVEQARDGIVIVQEERIILANQAMADMLGVEREALVNASYIDYVVPDDRAPMAARQGDSEAPHTFEVGLLAGDGSVRQVEVSSKIIDYEGAPASLAVLRDLTESRRLKRNLSNVLRRSEVILRETGEGFLRLGLDGEILEANAAFCGMVGYTQAELLGMKLEDIDAVEGAEMIRLHIKKILSEGYDRFETRHRCKDGKLIDMEVSKNCVTIGEERFIFAFYRDVTERKVTEKRLSLLYRAVEQSPSIIILTNSIGQIEYVNSKFTTVTGYEFMEIVGRDIQWLMAGELPDEEYDRIWKTLREGQDWQGVLHNRRKNGPFYWQSTLICPIRDPLGTVTSYLAIGEDITQLKSLQDELVRMEHLATLGEASANTAHCMKNITSAILNGVSQVEAAVKRKDPDLFNRAIHVLKRAATREYLVLMNMLDLSRERSAIHDPVQIDHLFEEVVNMLKCCAEGRNIEMDYRVDPGAEVLPLDSERLFRSLLNLGHNAIDAMPDGGRLSFNAFIEEPENDPALKEGARPMAVLEVSDTGEGITEEQINDIFKPFYSTKGSRGTGLGLSSVKQFIDEQGGMINVHSKPSVGTTFRMSFALDLCRNVLPQGGY